MRSGLFIRCSASALALALASPALSQTAPPEPTSPAAEDEAATSEIIVTGLRQSLQSAARIKRDAPQIVDVVVAEDIGKLPDRTVSEALARIPGVTVTRSVGEAGDIFIRGLPRPTTTYNGRDIFTAEARQVAAQDFPAGGVAALEVFKTNTADQIEGNLAGLINVRSRRPFDFRDFELSGAINATYADRSRSTDYNGNLLISKRWETGAGEFGALLNVSFVQLKYQDSARFVSGDFFGIDPVAGQPGVYADNGGTNTAATVRVPAGVGYFQSPGFRQRPSGNASLQWKPTPELQFYVDALYQGFRREVSDRQLFIPAFAGSAYRNVTFLAPGYVGSVDVTAPATADGFQAANKERTDTYQVAAGAIYENEIIKVAFDAGRTKSKFDLSIYSVDYRLNRQADLTADFVSSGQDGGGQFALTGVDLTDLNTYLYRGFFDRQLYAKGDDYQFRFDTTLKNVTDFIPGIQFGVRYVDRAGSFSNGERYSQLGANVPYGSLPLQFALTRDGYRGDVNAGVRQLNLPTYDSIRGAISQLRTIAGFTQDIPAANPGQSYAVTEKAMTGYGQINYGFEFGSSTRLDGTIGLRAIITDFKLRSGDVSASGAVTTGATTLFQNSYTDYLPNVTARLRFGNSIQLRASYTETRQRADFNQLNPGVIIPPGGNQIPTANGGNPNLRPVTSKNYDVSIEGYFGPTGVVGLALFNRDVTDVIVNVTQLVDIAGVGPVNLSGPFNVSQGRLRGFEAQFRTFFDFDFLPVWSRRFGTELNYTYVDNRLNAPPGFAPGATSAFPSVSKHTYNLVGFYEDQKLTARVAYNRRSRFSDNVIAGPGGVLTPEFIAPISRLDASISYALFDRLTIAADVSNLLAKPFRNFREIAPGVIYPRDVRYEERVFSIGLRFRLGAI